MYMSIRKAIIQKVLHFSSTLLKVHSASTIELNTESKWIPWQVLETDTILAR